MSISFTPDQLRVITLAIACNDLVYDEGVRESSAVVEIFEFHYSYQLYRSHIANDDFEAAERLYDTFAGDIRLIGRAYQRFFNEVDYYARGLCKLSVVRQYHRLLIGTLAPFKPRRVKGF